MKIFLLILALWTLYLWIKPNKKSKKFGEGLLQNSNTTNVNIWNY